MVSGGTVPEIFSNRKPKQPLNNKKNNRNLEMRLKKYLGIIVLAACLSGTAASATPNDLDGDGETDLIIKNGNIYRTLLSSSGDLLEVRLGRVRAKTVSAPGDYDGDGRTDLGIVEMANDGSFVWSINDATGIGFETTVLGERGDTVVAGCDFDGDGRSDIAIISGRVLIRKNYGDAGETGIPLPNRRYRHYSCFDIEGDGSDELVAGYRMGVPGFRRKRLHYDAFSFDGSSALSESTLSSTLSALNLIASDDSIGLSGNIVTAFSPTNDSRLYRRISRKLLRASDNFTLAAIESAGGSFGSGVIFKLANHYYKLLGQSVQPFDTSGLPGIGRSKLVPAVNVQRLKK